MEAAHTHIDGPSGWNGNLATIRQGHVDKSGVRCPGIEVGVTAAVHKPGRTGIDVDSCPPHIRKPRSTSNRARSWVEIGMTTAIDESGRPRVDVHACSSYIFKGRPATERTRSWIEIGVASAIHKPGRNGIDMHS